MRAPSRPPLKLRRLGWIGLALTAAGCGSADRAPLVADPVPVFRGHRDIDVASSREPVPRVIGRQAPVGLCLDAPPATDTSQWEARLLDDRFVPPAARLDTTVCFEEPIPAALADGARAMCAVLRDRFDGTTQALPCLPFRLETDDRALADLEGRIPAAVAAGAPALDALSDDARKAGFAGLAFRVRLIAAYALRREGTDAARAAAAERLRDDPAWVRGPAAVRWAGPLDYERASLALDARADLSDCWRLLRRAEESFRVGGDRKWIAVVGKQAEVLSRAGALAEAKERLRFAVAACGSAPCDPPLVSSAESTWAWLIASDPDATGDEIDAAVRRMEEIRSGSAAPKERLERANLVVNVAFLETRRGRSPAGAVAQARELIGTDASARARELAGWADLADARGELAGGDARSALAACDRIAAAALGTRLRAYGASCAASAHRRMGELDRASESYARALALHAASIKTPLAREEPVGPSQQAEDAYAAARVEVERGHPGAAWAILAALDDAAAAPPAALPAVEPWLALQAQLDVPASESRREEREAIRWAALDRMRDAIHVVEPRPATPALDGDATDFRAFPLDDEVVVLRRLPEGTITTYRRTPILRDALVRRLAAVRDALTRGTMDDAGWDELVEPLARAVAPRPEDVDQTTTLAMHGILQEIPLAALPIPGGERRRLCEITAPVCRPAGASPVARDLPATYGPAVVIADPRGDLSPAATTGGIAWSGKPTTILRGRDATRDAVRRALPGAGLLHVDAHARYEPAFPELTTILLADGAATGQEIAAWAPGLALANLSGCETGRAPVSADSGRFGIAGLLARSGVPWVVGAGAPLADAAAAEFNRAFYASVAGGADAPGAFRSALESVRRRYPASQWGAFVLLRGAAPNRGGQMADRRTPSSVGGLR
jgi:hypothetical protein